MKKLAVVGATGLVGRTVLKVLEEKNLPIDEYVLFSSKKSAGSTIHFLGKDYLVKELTEDSFIKDRFSYAIFCAGGATSLKFAPIASSNGCIVIDNSSAFRMNKDVPLVVPEVNPEDIFLNNGIIANPNCSTIQAMLPLKALDDNFKIKRIIYSTYQAVSGAGRFGIDDLKNGIKELPPKKFPYPIFNNCIPHIDSFLDNGYTKEEEKMINETRKILHKPELPITATCVRVPVINCHCESINVEFEQQFDLSNIFSILSNYEHIKLKDDVANLIYPLPTEVSGRDDVYIGRIRRDFSVKSGLNLWVVADNVRKGAATNAIQILEKLCI
jgi:aspartate-semialdehyde dehydrogenase